MIKGCVTVHAVGVREKSYCNLALVAETPKAHACSHVHFHVHFHFEFGGTFIWVHC